MKAIVKRLSLLLVLVMAAAVFTGCNGHTFAKSEKSHLLEAKQLTAEMQKDKVVVVDMQSPENYAKGHVTGAVNIPTDEIVISVPVKNMLTTKKKLEKAMNKAGISNDTSILVYDDDKMSAARFMWTMWMYGHEDVTVVDGGIEAVKAANVSIDTAEVVPEKGNFTAGEPLQNYLATTEDVLAQVNSPDSNVILLDVRSDEEFAAEGKIPTAIMRNYLKNYYADATLKSVQTTQIDYLQEKIYPENEIIIYCKTSFRAAPVFLNLYEAGYRNIRIYDGAWLEWTMDSARPVELMQGAAAPSKKDAS